MRAMSLAAAFRRISGLTGISRILGFLVMWLLLRFWAGPAADKPCRVEVAQYVSAVDSRRRPCKRLCSHLC